MSKNATDTAGFQFEANKGELRGDYEHMRADYTVDQDMSSYTATDQETWRFLYLRQSALLDRYAAPQFRRGVAALDMAGGIPDLARASAVLTRLTGWRLVAVPGIIPEDIFFDHLANRRFPVTVWIRRADEMDYLAEPDIFHDFFGHVPMLSDPVFADYMQEYGRAGEAAAAAGAIKKLARLYWYMVEFGLIETEEGLRVYGAGILSSSAETQYAIESDRPNRIAFDLERVMRTRYRIDDFQATYFVLDSLDQLMRETAVPFAPIYARLRKKRDLAPGEVLASDRVLHRGTAPEQPHAA